MTFNMILALERVFERRIYGQNGQVAGLHGLADTWSFPIFSQLVSSSISFLPKLLPMMNELKNSAIRTVLPHGEAESRRF